MIPEAIYTLVMISVAILLLLFLIIRIEVKLSRITRTLDEISDSAANFLKMGVRYFKNK